MAHLHLLPPLYTLLPQKNYIAHRNNTSSSSSPPNKTMAIQAQLSAYQQNPWLASQESQLEQQRFFMQQLRQNQILKPTTTSYHNQEEMEFDQLLQLQTERLRAALQEQRKHHTAALLTALESKTQLILTQKDQELAAAAQRTAQLQTFLQKLETEGRAWRRAAEENEAVVMSLNRTLEELSKDRESRTGGAGAGRNAEESGENDDGVGSGTDPCKSCNARGACVLFLPCRHLCTCKACEKLLGFCPVCGATKKATVEALIS